jgi:hypothetical protein
MGLDGGERTKYGVLEERNFYKEILAPYFQLLFVENEKPAIVVFAADRLPPAAFLHTMVEKLAEDWRDEAVFFYVNTDLEENHELAREYHALDLVAILFFRNKEITDRISGLVSKGELRQRILRLLGHPS